MKTLLSWSSGKDCAWALQVLRQRSDVEVVGLLTTLNQRHERVAMHAVRQLLLRAQAAQTGLPLIEIPLPDPCTNDDYERLMSAAMSDARAAGVEAVAFGDLFLEDIREYRETRLAPTGIGALFPLWGSDTTALSREMLDAGLCATITCVDPKQLDPKFAGRRYDSSLLAELPPSVDPCGERGEFHTFVWGGPMFESALDVETGEVVERDGFVFADVLPREGEHREETT
jgi:uncharacterized protein (TIGR00290 family)